MDLAIIGVPFNSAGLAAGEALAPAALRRAGLTAALARHLDVVDRGDLTFAAPAPDRDPVSGIIAPRTLVAMIAAVRTAVRAAWTAKRLPIVVGGECPLLLGCLAAARDTHGRAGLLFIDGHEDAYPPHASTTGETADMELGFALGTSIPAGLDDLAVLLPLVRPQDVVVLGARDAAALVADGVPSLADRVTVLDAAAVRAKDADTLIADFAARTREISGRWWLHVDFDVLSSDALAAVRYPQPGGLTWDELGRLTDAALAVPGLLGIDLTIYNPDLDPDGAGARRIVAYGERIAARLAAIGGSSSSPNRRS